MTTMLRVVSVFAAKMDVFGNRHTVLLALLFMDCTIMHLYLCLTQCFVEYRLDTFTDIVDPMFSCLL